MIVLAYYEASLVVDHLMKTCGPAKMNVFLRAYGKGAGYRRRPQGRRMAPQSIRSGGFDAVARPRFRRPATGDEKRIEIPADATVEQLTALAQANPDRFPGAHASWCARCRNRAYTAGAIRQLEQAAQLIPRLTRWQNPHVAIAKIASRRDDTARAIQAFDAFLKVDGNEVEFARKRAQLLEPLGVPRGPPAYERVVDVDPVGTHARRRRPDGAAAEGRAPTDTHAFGPPLASLPPDKATARISILRKPTSLPGRRRDAKREALAALEIAPSFEPAQELLLKIVDRRTAGGA